MAEEAHDREVAVLLKSGDLVVKLDAQTLGILRKASVSEALRAAGAGAPTTYANGDRLLDDDGHVVKAGVPQARFAHLRSQGRGQ